MRCRFCAVVTMPTPRGDTRCDTEPDDLMNLTETTSGWYESNRWWSRRMPLGRSPRSSTNVQAPSWKANWDVACDPPCINPTDFFSAEDWSDAPSRKVVRFNADSDSQCYEFDAFVEYIQSKHPSPVNDPVRGNSRTWTLETL